MQKYEVGQILYLVDIPMVCTTVTPNSIKTVRIWNQEQVFEEWKLGVLSSTPKG